MYNFGSKIFSSLAPKIWELVPDTIKNEKLLSSLKSQTQTWTTAKGPNLLNAHQPSRIYLNCSDILPRVIILLSLPLVNLDYFYFIISVIIFICSQFIFHLFLYHIFCHFALKLGGFIPNYLIIIIVIIIIIIIIIVIIIIIITIRIVEIS